MTPEQAAMGFDGAGRVIRVVPLGRGNVNDTYEVFVEQGPAAASFVLQRINGHVFPRPDWIMANMRVFCEHVHRRHLPPALAPGGDWRFPDLIRGRDGRDFVVDPAGHYWRAITKVPRAVSWPEVRDLHHACEAGAVLARFHLLVSDLDPARLHDALPGFHICPQYLARYDEVADRDPARLPPVTRSRSQDPGGEVNRLKAWVERRRDRAAVLENARASGALKQRIIHGDPKIDNIMVDETTGRGVGLIDLDTVKPGLVHYDIGDGLRSGCNPAGESPDRLESVRFDLDRCRAFLAGYAREAGGFLTAGDREFLFESVWLLTLELGLRFLQDHLAGDAYFKVWYRGHNLDRAAVQFALCDSIETQEGQIRKAFSVLG
jgi:hypothetical protein